MAVTSKDDPDSCAGTCDAGGICRSKPGQTCASAPGGCLAGTTCADGFCCDQACTSTCLACDLAGLQGKCSPVSGAPHGKSCGAGECAGTCTGRPDGQCTSPTGNCGSGPTCSGGSAVGQSTCMNGSCVAPAPQTCPLGCNGSVCKTGCTSNADCAAPKICVSGDCLKIEQITAGKHACVRLGDGTVRCWGQNADGELGDGTTNSWPPAETSLAACSPTDRSSAPGWVAWETAPSPGPPPSRGRTFTPVPSSREAH